MPRFAKFTDYERRWLADAIEAKRDINEEREGPPSAAEERHEETGRRLGEELRRDMTNG